MKNIIFLFLFVLILFLSISCKKENNPELNSKKTEIIKLVSNKSNDPKYLLNPTKSDTMCIAAIERAKTEINANSKLFIKRICLGCRSKAFDSEIETVLKKKKIKLVFEDIDCVIYNGQTQGCYSGYIELKMKELYGENYFYEIENEAEKLFIQNIVEKDKIVSIYDLDDKEKPKIINQKVTIEDDYYTTIKANFPFKIKSYKSLYADITFIIEKNGTISNLLVSNWVNNAVDEKFKNDLIAKAIITLKKEYNHWNPGKYKTNKVRTENTLRINFE